MKNILFINSDSKKEIKLQTKVKIIDSVFSINISKTHIYAFKNSKIEVFTCNPFNSVKKFDYKKEVNKMLLFDDGIFLLNQKELASYFTSKFNIRSGNFRNSEMIKIFQNSEIYCGIQNKNDLLIFDKNLQLIKSLSCQSACSIGDIIVIGLFNKCIIYKGCMNKDSMNKDSIKDSTNNSMNDHMINSMNALLEINFPSSITALAVDSKFTKIFAGCSDGNIYSYNFKEIKKLEFHKFPIKKIIFGGCYVYAHDGVSISEWSFETGGLLGFAFVELKDFDLIEDEEREYKEIPINFF